MEKSSILAPMLDLNKSLKNYWRGISNIFGKYCETDFLWKEMDITDEIVFNLVGLSNNEKRVCNDPLRNVLISHNDDEITTEEATERVNVLKDQLKEIKVYSEPEDTIIIEKLTELYFSLEVTNQRLIDFLNIVESPLEEDLYKVANIVGCLLGINEVDMDQKIFMNLIYDQIYYRGNKIKDVKEIVNIVNRILNQ